MKPEGFRLKLKYFCAYCPDFEPEIEKADISNSGEKPKIVNNIFCKHMERCETIAENIKNNGSKI